MHCKLHAGGAHLVPTFPCQSENINNLSACPCKTIDFLQHDRLCNYRSTQLPICTKSRVDFSQHCNTRAVTFFRASGPRAIVQRTLFLWRDEHVMLPSPGAQTGSRFFVTRLNCIITPNNLCPTACRSCCSFTCLPLLLMLSFIGIQVPEVY
jgi:hypothetical protein